MTNNAPLPPAARPAGKEHIPTYPPGFIAIRIVQLVLALIILGLTAYGVANAPVDGICLALAVAVMTLVSSIYHLVAHFGVPAAYNYWAILGLDIFFVVMWLCGFALLAARVGQSYEYYGGHSSSYYRYYGYSSETDVLLATQAAAAGLGGVEFILFIVSLIIHSIRLHRHRAAGLHCMPGSKPTPPTGPFPPGAVVLAPGAPAVAYAVAEKDGVPVPVAAYPYPPQQPMPAYMQGQQQPIPQQQQQFYAAAPPPPQGYTVPVPMPMPMPGQQMPPLPQQQQQGFYAPQPSQSPPPPQIQPIVPQPTGESHATTLASQQQQQQVYQGQDQQGQGQGQGQVPSSPQQLPQQLPAN